MENIPGKLHELISMLNTTLSSRSELAIAVACLVIFVLLFIRWGAKKTCSFSIVVVMTLILYNAIKLLLLNYSIDTEEGTIATLIRFFTYFFIVVSFIYYSFLSP
ncbi:MAG: hypothetical protein V1674_06080 [Candidatus Omnitrophota bacterium]